MDEIKELEKDYYELARTPALDYFEVVDENPKVEKVKLNDLDKRKDLNPIDIRERVNWLERRADEFEKTIALVNKNFDDYRQIVNEKLDKMGEKAEKLEQHEKIPTEVRDELSSLRLLVERVSNVNEELKTKTPQMLRELEGKINGFNSKISLFDGELKKVKEETKGDYCTRPIILE